LDLETAIFKHLSTYAGLTALVENRIYPLILPDVVTYPAVTFQMISGVDDHCINEDPDNTEARIQFTAWGKTAADVRNVQAQIKAAFKDFSGIMGGAGGVNVGHVLQAGKFDGYDDETKTFWRTQDFMIMYEE